MPKNREPIESLVREAVGYRNITAKYHEDLVNLGTIIQASELSRISKKLTSLHNSLENVVNKMSSSSKYKEPLLKVLADLRFLANIKNSEIIEFEIEVTKKHKKDIFQRIEEHEKKCSE